MLNILGWMLKNWKMCLGVAAFMVGSILAPVFLSSVGFVLDTKQANATVKIHDQRIIELEQATYTTNGRLQEIVNLNKQVLESNEETLSKTKQLLKEVRQLRRE